MVKSFLFEKLGVINPNWRIDNLQETYKMISSQFYIDGIYISMEGPKTSGYVQYYQHKPRHDESMFLFFYDQELDDLLQKTKVVYQ